MRVLMFGWEYPPRHLGGLGVACQGIVRGLLHHGADVTLVLPNAEAEEQDGLTILSPKEGHLHKIQVPSALQCYDSFASYEDRLAASLTNAPDMELYGKNLGGAVHAFTELSVEMTKDIKPDVVHSHDWMTFGAGAKAAAHHHVPFVAQVHATELDRTHFQPNEWIYHQERKGLLHSDRIITVSSYTRDLLCSSYGIPGECIDVVHNGTHDELHVDTLTNIHDQKPLVLFVGRLTVQKGPFHFLEAARIVREHNPDAQFVVAGDGYLLSELVDRSIQLGLQDNVIFAGQVHSDELRQLYRRASCFVMPSTSEPFGLVALEAIANGAPVILSKQSGVSEVIPHSLKVDFWDIDKLADCIVTVLREQPLAAQLKSEAPHTIHKLRWENQAEKVLSVYNKALNDQI